MDVRCLVLDRLIQNGVNETDDRSVIGGCLNLVFGKFFRVTDVLHVHFREEVGGVRIIVRIVFFDSFFDLFFRSDNNGDIVAENEAQFINGLVVQRGTESGVKRGSVELYRQNTEHTGVFRSDEIDGLFGDFQIGEIVDFGSEAVGDLFQKFFLGEDAEIHEEFLKRRSGAFVLLNDFGKLLFCTRLIGDENIFQRLVFSVKHGIGLQINRRRRRSRRSLRKGL